MTGIATQNLLRDCAKPEEVMSEMLIPEIPAAV